MRVGAARAAAIDWVTRHGQRQDGFVGAYVAGSTVGDADHAELPVGSDLDVMVVTEGAEPRSKRGKFLHQGALLEVTYVPWERIAPAERALASYHLAAGLQVDTVIASRELIRTGRYREAVFWMVATFALPQDPGRRRAAGHQAGAGSGPRPGARRPRHRLQRRPAGPGPVGQGVPAAALVDRRGDPVQDLARRRPRRPE